MIPSPLRENVQHFRGREWLLPPLLDWIERSERRMFLLTGPPGAGKSLLMAWLSGAGPAPADSLPRDQLARIRGYVKASHFCVAKSSSTAPRDFLESVADQLSNSVEGFAESLAESVSAHVNIRVEQKVGEVGAGGRAVAVHIEHLHVASNDDEAAFRDVLVEPLKRCCERQGCGNLVILVDSLDEGATHSGATTIVRLLTKLTDLPAQVRLLVSSRPDPRILRWFREVEPLDLEQAPDNRRDVEQYAREYLRELDEALRDTVAARVANAADGNFLYARLVLEDLLARHPSEQPEVLDAVALPPDLPGLYHDFLTREVGDDEERWEASLKPVLGLVAAARDDGLTLAQLNAISGRDSGPTLRALKQYFSGPFPDGPFRIFHDSFRGFLFDDASNLDYRIDAAAMHRRIADHYTQRTLETQAPPDEYGLRHLIAHLLACGDFDRAVGQIDQAWLDRRYVQCGYNDSGFLEDVTLVWQALIEQRPEDLVALTRVQAARVVVGRRLDDYTDEDLVNLVLIDRAAEAKAHAHLRLDAGTRVESLLAVYAALEERGQADAGLLDRAAESLPAIRNEYSRASAQVNLVQCNVRHGRLQQAESIARAIQDASRREEALGITAEALVRAGSGDRALELACLHREHSQTKEQAAALAAFARAQAEAGDHDTAERHIQAIPHARIRSEALCDLATRVAQAGTPERAEQIADAIPDAGVRGQALVAVALTLASKQHRRVLLDRALDAAAELDRARDYSWHHAGRGLVKTAMAAGAFEEARRVAQSLFHAEDRSAALLELATRHREAGDTESGRCFRDAEAAALDCDRPMAQAEALRDLAGVLARLGLPDASRVFDSARAAARNIEHPERRAAALEGLAIAMAQSADPAAVPVFREAARGIRAVAEQLMQENEAHNAVLREEGRGGFRFVNTPDPLRAAPAFAEALAASGDSEQALEVAGEIASITDRIATLYRVSRGMHAGGDNAGAARTFEDALDTTTTIENKSTQSGVLFDLLRTLDEDGRPEREEVLQRCIRAAEAVPATGHRVRELRTLATYLARRRDPAAAPVFDKTLKAARAHRPGNRRTQVLKRVIEAVIDAGQPGRAQRIAELITEVSEREAMLRYGDAMRRIDEGLLDDTAAIEDPDLFFYWKQQVQHALALAFASAGRLDAALGLAGRIVYRLEYDLGRPETSVQAMLAAGRGEDIPRWIEDLKSPVLRVMALRDYAAWQAETAPAAAQQVLEQAAAAADALDEPKSRPRLLASTARAAVRAGLYDQAREIAERIEVPLWRLQALSELAGAAAVSGDGRTPDLVALAEALARQLHAEGKGHDAFAILAAELLPAGAPWAESLFAEALEESRRSRARYNVLAEGLARAGRFGEALVLIGSGGTDFYVAQLAFWAPALEPRETGLSVAALREAAGVAGWVDETWAAVNEILSE